MDDFIWQSFDYLIFLFGTKSQEQDDVNLRKRFAYHCPFVREINRLSADSSHKAPVM